LNHSTRREIGRWILQVKSKEHPYLKSWDALVAAKAPDDQSQKAAQEFRELLVAVNVEKKSIDEKNLIRLGGSQDREVLSAANLLSLSRDKYILWRDFFSEQRIGEPVKLIIEFTANREGYQVDTIPDGWEPTSDVISLSPQSGVTPWLDEYMGGHRHSRDVFTSQKLSQTPTRVELLLNDTIRFDGPGKYSVQVTTRRVSPRSSSRTCCARAQSTCCWSSPTARSCSTSATRTTSST